MGTCTVLVLAVIRGIFLGSRADSPGDCAGNLWKRELFAIYDCGYIGDETIGEQKVINSVG